VQVAIVGTGGIGGYFGGLLARKYAGTGDDKVYFISRGLHLEKILEKGLKVISSDGKFKVNPDKALDDPAPLGFLDLVIFAVKSYDLEAAAEMFQDNISDFTTVITLLNGVNNAEVLSEILPECRLCNGCVYISAKIEEPGVIRHVGGPAKIFFGPVKGSVKEFEDVEKFLTDADIKAELTDNIDVEVWKKFMFMSPFAGVTTLRDQTFGEVLKDEESMELLKGMMKELEQLAREKGVDLPEDIVERSVETGQGFPPATKASMQLDFELGKRSELETFIGYVVKEGREKGLSLPNYELVYSELSARE